MVVVLILGVVKERPVPSEEPPLDAANQSKTAPEVTVAESVTVPVPTFEPAVVVTTEGTAFTTAVPDATFCVVAPLDAIAIFPPDPLAAVTDKRTKIVVFETTPPDCVNVSEEEKDPPVVKENS